MGTLATLVGMPVRARQHPASPKRTKTPILCLPSGPMTAPFHWTEWPFWDVNKLWKAVSAYTTGV